MIRLFVFLILCANLLISSSLHSQSVPHFSDSLQVSLVTSSPGTDLYAQFGHSIVRIVDYKFRKDLSFNYGTFDFNTPNFYWKFLQGKLNYQLAVHSTAATVRNYTYEKRQLTEQILNLTVEEKQAVVGFLYNNALPENKDYLYDFFYDNCATRIRDVLENEITNFSYVEAEVETYSFRQMLDMYVGDNPWINFGFYLILGYPTDVEADLRDQMFLPDYLSTNLTEYARNDGKVLLSAPRPLNQVTTVPDSSFFITPLIAMSFILLLSILFLVWGSEKVKRRFDLTFFTILGTMGLFMLFMWFGTDHWTTTKNLNVLWANPLFLLLWFMKSQRAIWLLILIMAIFLLFLGQWVLPQQFHPAFMPIWLTMIMRSVSRLGWVNIGK